MFERISTTPISWFKFILRMGKSVTLALILITISLLLGMYGYHHFEKMSWTDAYVNAAMILSGMGPVSTLNTEAGKIFAGTYALYSGLVLIAVIGIILAPLVHRLLHQFYADTTKE